MRVAFLDANNLVLTMEMTTPEWAEAVAPGMWIDADDLYCGVGCTYNPDSKTFDPAPEPPPEEAELSVLLDSVVDLDARIEVIEQELASLKAEKDGKIVLVDSLSVAVDADAPAKAGDVA